MATPDHAAEAISIPLERVAKFVRQISHDIRNGLNAIDLQATLIAELSTDPEIVGEARKLRGMVTNSAQSLQQLSAHFGTPAPNVITFPARELSEAIYDRMTKAFPEEIRGVSCACELDGQNCAVDFELAVAALSEIFKNAFQFREGEAAIQYTTRSSPPHLVLELTEKKQEVPSPPEDWGREPLHSTRRGGLGLGLFHARRNLEAQGGRLEQEFADGQLTTRVLLPLAADE